MLLLALLLAAGTPDVSNTYRIETSKVVKVKKGETGKAHFEVVPRPDAHVDPAAPVSLTVTAGPNLKVEKPKLGRAEARETKAKGVEFDVPFTATASDKLTGKLSFFICTEKLCEKQVKELALAVEVQ